MIVFLNERSLEPYTDWGAALYLFWEAATDLTGNALLLKDSCFFLGPDFKRRFQPSMAGFNPQIRAVLREIAFSERYWKCWRPSRVGEDDQLFVCENVGLELIDETLCEAAERDLRAKDTRVRTVSAPDSECGKHEWLSLRKVATAERAELPNGTSVGDVRKWIIDERGVYDPSSTVAPLDFQTVLVRDPTRFQRTNRMWHVAGRDRRIYMEIATANLLYVDEGHWGPSAHLEVFNANGDHLGEADIASGVLDASKNDPDKHISV
jgi:hypothetical protein